MTPEGWDVIAPLSSLANPRATAVQTQSWWVSPKPAPGPGYLSGEPPYGVTSVKGVPASAEVRVLYRPSRGAVGDGVLVASVISAPNGTWRVDGLDPELTFDVIFRCPGYNDMVLSQVKPTPYPVSP